MKLEAKDLQCGWESGKPIQKNINFSVENGEVCCILGPNGCGKSTLLKTVLALLPRQSGKITIDGIDVNKYSPKERAKLVAYVSQTHQPPFAYRVRDVVLLGRTSKIGSQQPTASDYQLADNALADMGVYHLRNALYTDISGGELQLVMIARALVQQPQLIVLDEPTAALDYGNAMRVIGKLRELAVRGYGVLMTTHSPDHAFMLDSNVLLLQRNKPMQFGRAVSIITEKNMRDAYGVDVETKEFISRDGEIVRMCAPVFRKYLREAQEAVKREEEEKKKAQEEAKKKAQEEAEKLFGKNSEDKKVQEEKKPEDDKKAEDKKKPEEEKSDKTAASEKENKPAAEENASDSASKDEKKTEEEKDEETSDAKEDKQSDVKKEKKKKKSIKWTKRLGKKKEPELKEADDVIKD